jgi:hypothetical protein
MYEITYSGLLVLKASNPRQTMSAVPPEGQHRNFHNEIFIIDAFLRHFMRGTINILR